MAQKKITDLQLIGSLTDSVSFPVDNGIQTYRSTGAQFKSFLASLLCPTGAVSAFAGSSAPSGWLLCDGSAISRTTYSDLFGVIGTTYGVGDGTTTFNIPDLRGIFVRGVGSQTISAKSFSGTLAAKSADQFQTHGHSITDPTHAHTGKGHVGVSGGPTYDVIETSGVNGASAAIYGSATGITVGAPNSGLTGSETYPANIGLNYMIHI